MTDELRAFAALVRARRSVRAFEVDPVPDEVVDACLDLALLAPSSHNLHPWEFVHVVGAARDAVRAACLDQAAARSAPTFLVAIARPDRWRLGRRLNLAHLEGQPDAAALRHKYRVLVPLIFDDGPWHLLAPLKQLVVDLEGWVHPTWRGPFGAAAQRGWATKSTALACGNLMLALRAAGYDSCPLEGFDEPRLAALLGCPAEASIVMVLAAGKRAPGGVTARARFDRRWFVRRLG